MDLRRMFRFSINLDERSDRLPSYLARGEASTHGSYLSLFFPVWPKELLFAVDQLSNAAFPTSRAKPDPSLRRFGSISDQ